MKKIFALTLVILMLLTSSPVFASTKNISINIGGHAITFPDVHPYLLEGQPMIPIRQPAELVGLKVSFIKADSEIHLTADSVHIKLKIGESHASINGIATSSFGSVVALKESRAYVPLAFFREVLQLDTAYSPHTLEAVISKKSLTKDLTLPTSLVEDEIEIGAGTPYALKGTLTMPKNPSGPLAAVILVHGSGPSDRDETVGGYKPFRDIAWGLAEQGIAVLRYDKRTLVHARSFTPEMLATFTIKEETIDDAIAATTILKKDKRIDSSRVFLAGHSLGGMMAPRIDAEGGDYAGLIILAGTTRSLWEISYDQNMAYIEAMDDQDPAKKANEAWLAAQLIKAKSIKTMTEDEALTASAFSIPAFYLRDMDIHSTTEFVAKLSKPILVLQGEDDFQVYADKDFTLWQEQLKDHPKAEMRLYPGLNHFFVNYDGIGNGTIEEYKYAGTVDVQVINDMAQWINGQ